MFLYTAYILNASFWAWVGGTTFQYTVYYVYGYIYNKTLFVNLEF